MFGSSKPTASLSSGLLARKGQARPAMRPQGFHGPSVSLDDLGWNDMGDDRGDERADERTADFGAPAPVIAITPVTVPLVPPVETVPPVLIERKTLREEIEACSPDVSPVAETTDVARVPVEGAQPAVEPVAAPVVEPPPVPPALVARIKREVSGATSKAAFTLRLDADRHLRLRLASATRNRSAQALVIAALDTFLASLPEVEGLVSQLSTNPTSKGKLKS